MELPPALHVSAGRLSETTLSPESYEIIFKAPLSDSQRLELIELLWGLPSAHLVVLGDQERTTFGVITTPHAEPSSAEFLAALKLHLNLEVPYTATMSRVLCSCRRCTSAKHAWIGMVLHDAVTPGQIVQLTTVFQSRRGTELVAHFSLGDQTAIGVRYNYVVETDTSWADSIAREHGFYAAGTSELLGAAMVPIIHTP